MLPPETIAASLLAERLPLTAFFASVTRDFHLAEDVLQEVWVLLSAELEKGTRIQNQAAWCRGVARNLIRRHWEKRQMAKVVADRKGLPAFLIENSTATLCGINERNYNRQPVTLWVRETQGTETRETSKMPWVYLS